MKELIIIIIFLILCFYFIQPELFVSNRDYLGEVLLSGRPEIQENKITYTNNPPSFKLNVNKISSNA